MLYIPLLAICVYFVLLCIMLLKRLNVVCKVLGQYIFTRSIFIFYQYLYFMSHCALRTYYYSVFTYDFLYSAALVLK